MKIEIKHRIAILLTICTLFTNLITVAQNIQPKSELDQKVERFLDKHKYRWHDMNIPTEDGAILFDLIINNQYTSALEIGTSTGHSAIWIAWALSKTGGKLITIEINETRYQKALANFREAGLEDFIDARLGDAHEMVAEYDDPVDFVFCDADKGWYKNYFKDIRREINTNGCFVGHSISENEKDEATEEFINYIEKQSDFKTSFEHPGMVISYKIK